MIKAVIFDMYETLITLYESPFYFGRQMALDIGIDNEVFLKDWDAMEDDRSIGKLTLEEALEIIMKKNHCFSEKLLNNIVKKRVEAKQESFRHLHTEIIPMLSDLKERGIKIGLISNCFSEEAMVIRESKLFPFFDAVYLSYEQGIKKPDKEIFNRCMTELSVLPYECIYVGDGGSYELETAEELGMRAFQATWYLKEGSTQPMKEMQNFSHVRSPHEITAIIEKCSTDF